jgi:hypothetical protein
MYSDRLLYLDYGQGDPAYEPLNIGSYVPLEKVYSFETRAEELTADEAKYIIGGQANIWTEYIRRRRTRVHGVSAECSRSQKLFGRERKTRLRTIFSVALTRNCRGSMPRT